MYFRVNADKDTYVKSDVINLKTLQPPAEFSKQILHSSFHYFCPFQVYFPQAVAPIEYGLHSFFRHRRATLEVDHFKVWKMVDEPSYGDIGRGVRMSQYESSQQR